MPAPPQEPRRLAAPWTVIELDACFKVMTANDLTVAHIYFEDGIALRREKQKLLTKDEARKVANRIAAIPSGQ